MALKATGLRLELVPPGYPLIDVTRPYVGANQQGHSLCWAACVESALRSPPNNKRVSQARLARRFIGRCNTIYRGRSIRGTECDKPLQYQNMVSVWRQLGFADAKYSVVPTDLGSYLLNELYERGPVQAWIDRFHGVMVYGFREKTNGKQKVLVMDPQPGIGDGWRSLSTNSGWSAIWSGLHA